MNAAIYSFSLKVWLHETRASLTSIVGENYCSVSHILQNIVLCVQNKHIHTGLEILEGE